MIGSRDSQLYDVTREPSTEVSSGMLTLASSKSPFQGLNEELIACWFFRAGHKACGGHDAAGRIQVNKFKKGTRI